VIGMCGLGNGTPPGPDCCLTTSADKTHTPPPTICMVTEGAEKNPTQAHVSAPRGPEGEFMRNESKLRLPHVAVNQNPDVRL
jgi:hypothetical protein